MAINKTGRWWVGSMPTDIHQYLEDLAGEDSAYPIDAYRQSHCKCGSTTFSLLLDDEEGCARRACSMCGSIAHFLDSEDIWEDSKPHQLVCVECTGSDFNAGGGFSLYPARGFQLLKNQRDVRWFFLGVRCDRCGILGCPVDWKVGYGPARDVFKKV